MQSPRDALAVLCRFSGGLFWLVFCGLALARSLLGFLFGAGWLLFPIVTLRNDPKGVLERVL